MSLLTKRAPISQCIDFETQDGVAFFLRINQFSKYFRFNNYALGHLNLLFKQCERANRIPNQKEILIKIDTKTRIYTHHILVHNNDPIVLTGHQGEIKMWDSHGDQIANFFIDPKVKIVLISNSSDNKYIFALDEFYEIGYMFDFETTEQFSVGVAP